MKSRHDNNYIGYTWLLLLTTYPKSAKIYSPEQPQKGGKLIFIIVLPLFETQQILYLQKHRYVYIVVITIY